MLFGRVSQKATNVIGRKTKRKGNELKSIDKP